MEVLYTYVLQLEEGKWYVGKTNDPFNRLMEHVNESGSVWTRRYAPVQVHEVKPFASKYDEDNTTMEYMEKYGVDNVRGGCYVQIVLPPEQKREIQRKWASANDACFKCGKSGHTVANCPVQVTHEKGKGSVNGQQSEYVNRQLELVATDQTALYYAAQTRLPTRPKQRKSPAVPVCLKCGESGHSVTNCLVDDEDEVAGCSRCGRNTHDASTCYAKVHIDGGQLREGPKRSKKKSRAPSPVECRRCGRDTHDEALCYAKTLAQGFSPNARSGKGDKKNRRGDGCFRCGRAGHWEGDCYAKTNIDGDPI